MKNVILACLVATAVTFHAQQQPGEKKPFIEVTGSSETEVVPDEIYITITLEERKEGRDDIAKQEADLKSEIKSLGIDLSNLTLLTADADYKSRAFRKDAVISKSYLLKVGNAEMVSRLYERLDKINAKDAYISRYTHSKIRDIQRENRTKALSAAKEKADYLLKAIQKQAGDPLQIIEQENYVQEDPSNRRGIMNNMAQSFDKFIGGEDEISFRKIKVRSSFLARFEIR